MKLRSILFVPGDRPDRIQKARTCGADALILDLEDAVAPANKGHARTCIAAALAAPDRPIPLFVRVNPLDSGHFADDLDAVLAAAPDALVLPKAEGAASVERLAALAPGIPILPIATETPAAIFELGSYRSVSALLLGLTWGAEDLPAAIGASTSREADGSYTAPYLLARSLTLFAAHAANVAAIETVYPDIKDDAGLDAYARRAARDGFSAMLAIHPRQIAIINAAMQPGQQDIEQARAIVAAFTAQPDRGALQVNGRMVDAPHLKQAHQLLARAGMSHE
jgi:citrate lyase subunit beta/citryl-CoA lyase